MSEVPSTLPAMLDLCWHQLIEGVRDAAHPARRPVLASIGSDGGANARIVVLRAFDFEMATLDMHTDIASPKVAELLTNPSATLLFWDPAQQFQIRLGVTITVLSGPDVTAIWNSVPDAARGNYGGHPTPGQRINAPDQFSKTPRADRFAVLRAKIASIDALHLASDPHRRARFEAQDGFTGLWVAP